MQCSAHPEWSAPCSVIRIFAIIYGFFLILVIILAIISIKKLRTVKKQIEIEFNETINKHIQEQLNEENKDNNEENEIDKKEVKTPKPKKAIAKSDKKISINKKSTTKKSTSKK
jgi:predicted Holliday junction resolvase-like endonuclease